MFPNMKVLCHPEEGDAKVVATLDPITIDCSVCLIFEAMSLIDGVTVVVVAGVSVCSVEGTSDLVEGSLDILNLFLRVQGVGEVFVEKFIAGLTVPW